MSNKARVVRATFLIAALFAACAGSKATAQDAAWRVSKSSGEAWFTTSGAQAVALGSNASLKPGDTIRTGGNGRVLLVRGAESMLISANSIVGLPAGRKDGMSTTIMQQAGTILLEVEKRNVQHFEVATPYLAAVVKGTQFRVSVSETGGRVDVLKGQVQVMDYKTGQYALVKPNQIAQVSSQGSTGLSLSGSGTLSPVQNGPPRSPMVTPVATPSESPVKVPNENSATPDRGRDGQQVLVPAQAPVRQAARAWQASDAATGNSDWGSDIMNWGKNLLGFGGRKGRDDNLSLMLAFPAVIGFSVAIGAAAIRRRKKQKPDAK